MKHFILIVAAVALGLTGCIDDSVDKSSDTHTLERGDTPDDLLDLSESFPPDMEVVVVHHADSLSSIIRPGHRSETLDRDMDSIYWADGVDQPDVGPCACDGPTCVQNWVDANLGCNLCAVFVCEGPNVHACNNCN